MEHVSIPGPNATWREIEVFALTFDGYKRIGPRLAELAERHRKAGTVPGDLDELRGCLFLEQRAWRHAQCVPDEAGMKHIRALIEGIRLKLPLPPTLSPVGGEGGKSRQ